MVIGAVKSTGGAKLNRQRKILDIIREQVVCTQAELAAALREAGFNVTQATVSRDIKELGLIKVPAGENAFRYSMPQAPYLVRGERRLKRFFRDSVVKIDSSENLVIIKTQPGEAQGVASALDNVNWKEIIGTVAGDDTILVVIKPRRAVSTVLKRFAELLER